MPSPAPPPPDETDEALASLAASGDRAAFDRLASRTLPRLYRAALHVLGDTAEAEDVAQEAMLRAWTAIGRFDPRRARFSTWAHRIAVNLAVDRSRALRPATALSPDLPDPSPGADAVLARRQGRSALAAAVADLPERQRVALAMTYAKDQPATETARALHVSPRAVEGLLRRARLLIRERLLARDA